MKNKSGSSGKKLQPVVFYYNLHYLIIICIIPYIFPGSTHIIWHIWQNIKMGYLLF